MTANRDAQGNYRNPLRPTAGAYISVTTALSAGIPKALDNWHKKLVAEYAVDNRDAWTSLDRDAAVDLIKRASDRQRDAAADRGSVVHAILEGVRAGVTPDPTWSDDVRGLVRAGLRFFDEWQPDIYWQEVEVFSDQHRYAGTLDMVAWLPGLGLYIVDWKTGKNIYPEAGAQVAAYRNADYAVIGDVEHAIPAISGGACVHLRADGTYELVPVDSDAEQFDLFLHALHVARWTRGGKNSVVGKPIPTPAGAMQARAEWLTLRVATIRDTHGDVALNQLASIWPPNTPTLREGGHTRPQLDAIADAVSAVEAHYVMPFPPSDPNSDRVQWAELEPLYNRVRALPDDLRDAVDDACRAVGVPQLKSGRVTRGQVDLIAELTDDAEQAASERMGEALPLVQHITGDNADLAPAVWTACGVTNNAVTRPALERLHAIKQACERGVLVFVDGTLTAVDAEGRLVDWFGTKRDALTTVKQLAEKFGLDKPRSVAAAAEQPALIALAMPTAA